MPGSHVFFLEVFFFFFPWNKLKVICQLWCDVCSPNTHANMLKRKMLQHVERHPHACIIEALWPLQRLHISMTHIKKIKKKTQKLHEGLSCSLTSTRWMDPYEGLLKVCSHSGLFFGLVSVSELGWKEKLGEKRNFQRFARFGLWLSYELSRFTVIKWWFIPKLHQQTIKKSNANS